ncbi:uncharacterized protein [Haliotis asinina]|uniref:uncharacterized protein n=1 Tax=Haliotis asinina TaxID=109174 RepID=UPI0035318A58
MNWVGGARKRVKLQGEKRLQKEFFERKRLQPKLRNQFRGSSAVKNGAVSRDLLALQTVCRIQYSDQDLSKPVRKLDLDKFKSTVCGRKHNEVELPPSPNEMPSMISLFEQGCSSNTSGTYNRLPSFFSKSSSIRPRIMSGSEYDSSSSPPGQSHLSSGRWQGYDRPFSHKHMSSQDKISYNNKKIFDPFDGDFVRVSKNIRPVPDLLKSEKPFIKTHEPICDGSHPTKCDKKTSYKHTITPTQTQDNLQKMTLHPWVVEDFCATPLVRYEAGHKKAGRLPFPSGGAYKSLTDRGYVSEQSKTDPSHHHKFQCKIDGWSSDKGHDNIGLQSCGLLLDHARSTATRNNLQDDVYDGYIENRFRAFKPNKEMGERKKLGKSQEMFSFSKLEKSCFDMETRKSKTMRPSSPPSLARQNLVDIFNKRDMENTFSESLDFKRNDVIPKESYGSQILTDYDLILSSGTNGDRKSVDAFEVNSPQKADMLLSPCLPYLEEERSFKGDHRDPKTCIPSTESSTSSCNQAKHHNIQDDLSDFDWGSHGSSTVSPGNQATNKDRFRASRITEIFEEMRQLENESEDETHGLEDGNQTAAVTPTDKLQSERQEDAVDADTMSEEDQLVVNQVVQELVHNVVLQDAQTVTHTYSSRFAVPSKTITSAPWKSYKSIYAHTSARTEQGKLNMFRQEPMNCHNILYSQQVIASVDTSGPNNSVTNSGTPKSSKQVITRPPSPVNNWNKLDLISPVKTASLTQECIDSSAASSLDSRAMEGKLLLVCEGLTTPPKTDQANKAKSRRMTENVSQWTSVAWDEPILLEVPTGNITRDATPDHSLKGIHDENKYNKPKTPVKCSLSTATTPVTSMKFRKQMPHSSHLAEIFPKCDSCTQTDCTLTCDFATSPVIFPTSGKCEAGTQYDIEHDLVMLNDVDVAMEQGDSMDLMDCVAQMDVVLGDKQWTITDTILDTGSQTDNVPKYSLRSRKKSSFPDIV